MNQKNISKKPVKKEKTYRCKQNVWTHPYQSIKRQYLEIMFSGLHYAGQSSSTYSAVILSVSHLQSSLFCL